MHPHHNLIAAKFRRRFFAIASIWEMIGRLSGDSEGFSAKAHEFIAEGERIVCLGTYSASLSLFWRL
jgi:hypothetical protein